MKSSIDMTHAAMMVRCRMSLKGTKGLFAKKPSHIKNAINKMAPTTTMAIKLPRLQASLFLAPVRDTGTRIKARPAISSKQPMKSNSTQTILYILVQIESLDRISRRTLGLTVSLEVSLPSRSFLTRRTTRSGSENIGVTIAHIP